MCVCVCVCVFNPTLLLRTRCDTSSILSEDRQLLIQSFSSARQTAVKVISLPYYQQTHSC